jgi:TPR repeat protein
MDLEVDAINEEITSKSCEPSAGTHSIQTTASKETDSSPPIPKKPRFKFRGTTIAQMPILSSSLQTRSSHLSTTASHTSNPPRESSDSEDDHSDHSESTAADADSAPSADEMDEKTPIVPQHVTAPKPPAAVEIPQVVQLDWSKCLWYDAAANPTGPYVWRGVFQQYHLVRIEEFHSDPWCTKLLADLKLDETGDGEARFRLAEQFMIGETVPRSPELAVTLFIDATKSKPSNELFLEVQVKLYQLLQAGKCSAPAIRMAFQYLWRLSCETQGPPKFQRPQHRYATQSVAYLLRDGCLGIKKSVSEAVRLLTWLASSPHPGAHYGPQDIPTPHSVQLELVNMLRDGLLGPSAKSDLIQFITKSSNANQQAQYQLALAFRDGVGVEQSHCSQSHPTPDSPQPVPYPACHTLQVSTGGAMGAGGD